MASENLNSAMDVVMDPETPSRDIESPLTGYSGWPSRKLILAAHKIFLEHSRANVVKSSADHRGVIYWCLLNMDADITEKNNFDTDREDQDILHDGLTDFYHVWTLAEVFLLGSTSLPAAPLLRWLSMYSASNIDEEVQTELEQAEAVANNSAGIGTPVEVTPQYWKALRSLITFAKPRRAAQMLRGHPDGNDPSSEIAAVARQLEKMPLLLPDHVTADHGSNLNFGREEFHETWTRWQKGCKAAASAFGVVSGANSHAAAAAGGGKSEREHLRWLWGTMCGARHCLDEGTSSWHEMLGAVLSYEQPYVSKEEISQLLKVCEKAHPPHLEEQFILEVIRDASAGTAEAIVTFARDNCSTTALSACGAHLIDLLYRSNSSSVTLTQREWFLRRVSKALMTLPGGGWELAAAYVEESVANNTFKTSGDMGHRRLSQQQADAVWDMISKVKPNSERATHELVEWCHNNSLGEAAADAVCRARGEAWLNQTSFDLASLGVSHDTCQRKQVHGRIAGACGRAAYWLGRGGATIQLERLCAEVSERMMVAYSTAADASGILEFRAAVEEAEGVLASMPSKGGGQEYSFLEKYQGIADLLLAEAEARLDGRSDTAASHACRAGSLAIEILLPHPKSPQHDATDERPEIFVEDAPSRTWGHLLRLAMPTLRRMSGHLVDGCTTTGLGGESMDALTCAQLHALLAKLQMMSSSEHRVRGVVRDETEAPSRAMLYGFRDRKDEIEIRRALALGLAAAMMAEAIDDGDGDGVRGPKRESLHKPLTTELLMTPRVSVPPPP